jgi:hypothetical protein
MRELDVVVLTRDLPDEKLVAGDVGTIVAVHQGGAGYTVEFVTPGGDTIAVVTVPADGIRRPKRTEIAHARIVA